MNTTLVSVIIPSYNHAKFLKECVSSVLNQTHKNLELIVIDDGSKDDSLAVLKGFEDSRLTVYAQENRGADQAINRGLSLARGEYLTILNSDDIFAFDRIEKCLAKFEKQPDLQLLTSWIEIVDSGSKKIGQKRAWLDQLPWLLTPLPSLNALQPAFDEFELNLLRTNFVATTSNIIFSRKVYEAIGGMGPLRYAHDWDFLLRSARKFRGGVLTEPLLKYRLHATNTISSNRAEMTLEILWIWTTHLPYFEQKFIYENPDQASAGKYLPLFSKLLNLQGQERAFIEMRGMPEQALATVLHKSELKEAFLQMIREDLPVVAKPSFTQRLIGKGTRILKDFFD